jgi:hypothetical protein
MRSKLSNSRGFSHHFLLPVLAILLVGGIGSYVMLRSSSAASVTHSCTKVTFGRYKNNPVNYPKYKPCVKAIQRKVGATADGIFGNNTQARVKTWQRNHGLTADGVVGPKTWAKMGIHPSYTTTATKKKKDTSPPKTTTDKWAAARKDCQSNGGIWDRNNYCMKKINYCDWVKRNTLGDAGADMKLVCRTATVSVGAEYDKLWRRNDAAWNACRSYERKQHSANTSAATIERYCKDRVVAP